MARQPRTNDVSRAIMRRISNESTVQKVQALPAAHHAVDDSLFVRSELVIDIEPRLILSWRVVPKCWNAGFTLLGFHSTTGFSAERYPKDLNAHGQLVIEARDDGSVDERPQEGRHFYTFILHKKGFWLEKMSVLRFSETVPSAKVAIGRIKDQIDLQEMLQRHEVAEIEHVAKVNEARHRRLQSDRRLSEALGKPDNKKRRAKDDVVSEAIDEIDATVEALLAARQKKADLKADRRFKSLSRPQQRSILERVDERLDAGEISARREQRGQRH